MAIFEEGNGGLRFRNKLRYKILLLTFYTSTSKRQRLKRLKVTQNLKQREYISLKTDTVEHVYNQREEGTVGMTDMEDLRGHVTDVQDAWALLKCRSVFNKRDANLC